MNKRKFNNDNDNVNENYNLQKRVKYIANKQICLKRYRTDNEEIEHNCPKKFLPYFDIRCIFCFSKINQNDNYLCGHPFHNICLQSYLNNEQTDCIFCNHNKLNINMNEAEKIAIHIEKYIKTFHINTNNNYWIKINNFIQTVKNKDYE